MSKKIYFDEQKLNHLQMNEFENINIANMFHYFAGAEVTLLSTLKTFVYFLHRTLFYSNEFKVSGKADTLFLFSNSYALRKDLLKSFDKVLSLSENNIRMIGEKTRKMHLHFICNIAKLFSWNSVLKRKNLSFCERIFTLRQLYGIYTDYLEYLDFTNKNKIVVERLVTLCDVHAVDYYFTQKFNEQGKTTVTLQHGVFSSTANPWAYIASNSIYFLANSQYSVNEAIISGHKENGLYAVGLPSFIHEVINNKCTFNSKKIGKIGVILEGETQHEDNVEMLSFMQQFCKKNNIKLYIKFHPTSELQYYNDILDYNYASEICGKEKNILEFANLIDIAIVRNTTCLLELINQDIPSFIYFSERQKIDVYKNLDELRFRTEDELKILLQSVLETNYKRKFEVIQRYFGDGKNTTKNYRKVLNEIGIT